MKPLMTIADMAQINIEIALDESEIGLVRPGQSARIIVDAFHETEVSGVVQRIRPLPVRPPAPKEFIVVIEMKEISSNIRDRLRPGMSATAWIKVRS
jgi:HlyD family secretion protein